jgi:hypothetical protein
VKLHSTGVFMLVITPFTQFHLFTKYVYNPDDVSPRVQAHSITIAVRVTPCARGIEWSP